MSPGLDWLIRRGRWSLSCRASSPLEFTFLSSRLCLPVTSAVLGVAAGGGVLSLLYDADAGLADRPGGNI